MVVPVKPLCAVAKILYALIFLYALILCARKTCLCVSFQRDTHYIIVTSYCGAGAGTTFAGEYSLVEHCPHITASICIAFKELFLSIAFMYVISIFHSGQLWSAL